MTESTATPDVSVVIVSFNDSARLPRAIRSVQCQTLRSLEIVVVDDASTDDTEAIVGALAAADDRIRYERLRHNSGGSSAPRNRGIELASAPWIMFCDSGDEFERHACKNLLHVAERHDADVVCGTAERVDAASGIAERWRPEVHDIGRVADGLVEFPGLLYDTISNDKIFRHALLVDHRIRFVNGLHLADDLFTFEALASARRVASIPEIVYRWHVDGSSEQPLILEGGHAARDAEACIELNKRMDEYLAACGLQEVQRIKDLKFLDHDLRPWLSWMREVDDQTARDLLDRVVPYVAGVDLQASWQVSPALRVAIYHLLIGDVPGLRAAMRFLDWDCSVGAAIEVGHGSQWWACEHLDTGPSVGGRPAREWLEVTDLHLASIPFTQRRYLHLIDAYEVVDQVVGVTGTSVDYSGSFDGVDRLELRFLAQDGCAVASARVEWTKHQGDEWTWRTVGPLTPLLGHRLSESDCGTLVLAVERGTLVNLCAVRSAGWDPRVVSIPLPAGRRGTGPDALEISRPQAGPVRWRAQCVSPWLRRKGALARAWSRVPGVRQAAIVTSGAWLSKYPQWAVRAGALLPQRNLIVFESDLGRTAQGNSRAISEYLHANHPDLAQVWAYHPRADRMPAFAEAVARHGASHRWRCSRARYWVDDGRSSLAIRKPSRTITVLSGFGVPVHRLGLDDPSVLVRSPAVRAIAPRYRRYDLMVAPSAYAADLVGSAFGYSGQFSIAGIPRMDNALRVRHAGSGAIADLKRDLDLPLDRRVVLYAPTVRRLTDEAVESMLDLERWAVDLGDRSYLLVRAHPGQRLIVPDRLRFAIRDISDSDDLPQFMAAADLLVSDYSSIIGDAVLIDLPVILFQPDRLEFENRIHGVYQGLGAAGPSVASVGELLVEVGSWLEDPQAWDRRYVADRRLFAEQRCGPADGHSTERVVTDMLALRDRGRR